MYLILTYHRVFPGHHIDPETFEWQIKTLKEKFKPVALEKLINEIGEGTKGQKIVTKYESVPKYERNRMVNNSYFRNNLVFRQNYFAVTFDDGWADNFVYAYPILKKHNVPATIFVPTKFVNEIRKNTKIRNTFSQSYEEAFREIDERGYSEEFLTWDEIRQMSPLVSIESHGDKHLHHLKHSLKEIKEDLETSIKIIEKETGRQPKYLAWPYGEYNDNAIQIAKEVGFEACLTTHIGNVKTGDNIFELKRFAPPRNRKLFIIAASGDLGMLFYRAAVKIYSLFQ